MPTIVRRNYLTITAAFVASLTLVSGFGCNAPTTPTDGDGDNVLLTDALSFSGSLEGKVFETQSTRGSTTTEKEAAQQVPLGIDTTNTCVRFHDIVGNQLEDPNGEPVPEVQIEADGSFEADNLPVGTDFTVCVDEGKDGSCEQESCVNVPADESGTEGILEDVRVDPLTTIVLAKLRDLLAERNIEAQQLPVSPAAVVTRIVDAYTHLFEQSGIDHTVAREDIANISPQQLGELFDSILPTAAQSGMRIVEGNLRLVDAQSVEARAMAAAEVFLRAGFPIADVEAGADLSFLGELEGVTTTTVEELFAERGPFGEFEVDRDVLPIDDAGAPTGQNVVGPQGGIRNATIYIDLDAEPDRNFSNIDEHEQGPDDAAPLPIIRERILIEMARLTEGGGRITLGQLYEALTSIDNGLGLRLTYSIFDPNFAGPPLTVFETTDGQGRALNLERLFQRVFENGFGNLDPEQFDNRRDEFRSLLDEVLGDTLAPTFERLFAGILSERVGGIEDLARRIRSARVHLPFNRSGPGSFFVVADGDPFASDVTPDEITVDAELTLDGRVASVTFNPDGEGRYWLGFTERTEDEGIVELIVRETGRRLQGRRGSLRISMFNDSLFSAVDGQPFGQFVSESGRFFNGISVSVIRGELDRADGTEPGERAAQRKLFVLADAPPGPEADPVRVDYNRETGIATFNPNGRHLLMFQPDSQQTGEFVLFNEDVGRPVRLNDSDGIFGTPIERPDRFDEFFNEFGDGQDLEDVDDLGEFIDDFIDMLPSPPPPGEDGDRPEDDRDNPPADDGSMDTGTNGEDMPDDGTNDDGTTDTGTNGEPAAQVDPMDGSTIGLDDVDTGEVPPPPPTDGNTDLIIVNARDIVNLDLAPETFRRVFGVDVANPRHDADADPFYDDINENGMHDEGEPTAPFRPTLFNLRDWRSTDIALYYRRADNDESVRFEDVQLDSNVPMTNDGVALVPRNYRPRLNAFRFGRPNTAINLLTAFTPPDFFNGTKALTRETQINVFTAVAIVNLVMDQILNVEADVDVDGLGPLPKRRLLVDAQLFVVPVDDPFVVLIKSIADRVVQDQPGGPNPADNTNRPGQPTQPGDANAS